MSTPDEALVSKVEWALSAAADLEGKVGARDLFEELESAGLAIVRSDELAGLRALSDAATPGPWRLREYRNGGGRWSDDATDRILIADLYGTDPDDSSANRDFIVAAVNWVRAALEGVSR